MTRPVLLDLFCKQGGAGVGYHRAGFDVIGVDRDPQPRYPFEFWQADLSDPAVLVAVILAAGPDAIHASPPCQRFTHGNAGRDTDHPDLVTPTRPVLAAAGVPYVIENVPRAPLHAPLVLCGSEFDLHATDTDGSTVYARRHRLFEASVPLMGAGGCWCATRRRQGNIAGVYGAAPNTRDKARNRHGGYSPAAQVCKDLLGVPWMTLDGAQQCVPPAYTEHIGQQLIPYAEAS